MKNLAKSIIVFLALATAIPSHAEWEPEGTPFDGKSGNDFGVWMTVGAEKKINKKWSLGLEFEYRLRDNIVDGKGWGAPSRWNIAIGAEYKPLNWLKVDAGYKFMRDYSLAEWNDKKQEETTAFWGTKHRVYASVTGSYKVQNVKFSLRERWQYTYRPEVADVTYDWEHDRFEPKKGKGKNVSRTRLQISYDKKRTWWEPYISAEMYIAHGLEKMRYTAGCNFKINKQNHIDLYYRFVDIRENDNFNNRDSHVLGVGYQFKF
ncbi:MAG: DUF2490 domain-containing protein [Muribaculaceae bacterium]|nr:DUF2490 domain-containing protein [Muribaculaceae bacterium]